MELLLKFTFYYLSSDSTLGSTSDLGSDSDSQLILNLNSGLTLHSISDSSHGSTQDLILDATQTQTRIRSSVQPLV